MGYQQRIHRLCKIPARDYSFLLLSLLILGEHNLWYASLSIARLSGTKFPAALPSIHPGFCMGFIFAHVPTLSTCATYLTAIPTEPNGGNHTSAFASAAATPEAHQACLEVCKALALTGLRVIEDDQFYSDVSDCRSSP